MRWNTIYNALGDNEVEAVVETNNVESVRKRYLFYNHVSGYKFRHEFVSGPDIQTERLRVAGAPRGTKDDRLELGTVP